VVIDGQDKLQDGTKINPSTSPTGNAGGGRKAADGSPSGQNPGQGGTLAGSPSKGQAQQAGSKR
jgi:hypothetical protein